jgi:hypothetical protein
MQRSLLTNAVESWCVFDYQSTHLCLNASNYRPLLPNSQTMHALFSVLLMQ